MSAPSELELKTREWLDYALHDLAAGDWDLQCQVDLFEDCYFHAQQAVEKALKAWLLWNNTPFRKTHDIKGLLLQCQALGPELDVVAAKVQHFTPFVALGRYPQVVPPQPPTKVGAEVVLQQARELYDAVCGLVPPSARPPILRP